MTVLKLVDTCRDRIVSWKNLGARLQKFVPYFFLFSVQCLGNWLFSYFVTDMCFQSGCHAVGSGWLAVDRGRETIIKSQTPRAAGIYDRRCPGCQARLIWCFTSKINPRQLLLLYNWCLDESNPRPHWLIYGHVALAKSKSCLAGSFKWSPPWLKHFITGLWPLLVLFSLESRNIENLWKTNVSIFLWASHFVYNILNSKEMW